MKRAGDPSLPGSPALLYLFALLRESGYFTRADLAATLTPAGHRSFSFNGRVGFHPPQRFLHDQSKILLVGRRFPLFKSKVSDPQMGYVLDTRLFQTLSRTILGASIEDQNLVGRPGPGDQPLGTGRKERQTNKLPRTVLLHPPADVIRQFSDVCGTGTAENQRHL